MSEQEQKELAERIIERLFTNGNQQRAGRLVLELAHGRDGGGWSIEGARREILKAIRESEAA